MGRLWGNWGERKIRTRVRVGRDGVHCFMQKPVHPSFGWVKKRRSKKRYSKTIDIVSYASKVSVNGVICVFVVQFLSSNTFKVSKLA